MSEIVSNQDGMEKHVTRKEEGLPEGLNLATLSVTRDKKNHVHVHGWDENGKHRRLTQDELIESYGHDPGAWSKDYLDRDKNIQPAWVDWMENSRGEYLAGRDLGEVVQEQHGNGTEISDIRNSLNEMSGNLKSMQARLDEVERRNKELEAEKAELTKKHEKEIEAKDRQIAELEARIAGRDLPGTGDIEIEPGSTADNLKLRFRNFWEDGKEIGRYAPQKILATFLSSTSGSSEQGVEVEYEKKNRGRKIALLVGGIAVGAAATAAAIYGLYKTGAIFGGEQDAGKDAANGVPGSEQPPEADIPEPPIDIDLLDPDVVEESEVEEIVDERIEELLDPDEDGHTVFEELEIESQKVGALEAEVERLENRLDGLEKQVEEIQNEADPTPEPSSGFGGYDYPWDWAHDVYGDRAMEKLHDLANKAQADGHRVVWIDGGFQADGDPIRILQIDGTTDTQSVLRILSQYK